LDVVVEAISGVAAVAGPRLCHRFIERASSLALQPSPTRVLLASWPSHMVIDTADAGVEG
jgi:hypothetical protein